MTPRSRHTGFTLVELMVTLLLAAVLVGVGAPLGMRWADSASVTSAQAQLQHGFSIARALALQNAGQSALTLGASPAAVMCVDDASVRVYVGSACGGSASWSGGLGQGLAVRLGGSGASATASSSNIVCLPLSAAGLLTAGASGCGSVASSTTYTISKGLANVSKSFY